MTGAPRALGRTASERLHRAWSVYRATPEFAADVAVAQEGFVAGDLRRIVERLEERRRERAARRVAAIDRQRAD